MHSQTLHYTTQAQIDPSIDCSMPSPPTPATTWLQHLQHQQGSTPVLVALAVGLVTLLLLLLLRSKGKSSGNGKPQQGKGLPRSVAKAAYESLRARELAWLRGLPPQAQAALRSGNGAPRGVPAHASLHSGEVGMVLLGVKPCAVVEDRRGVAAAGGSSFSAAFAEEVVRFCVLCLLLVMGVMM